MVARDDTTAGERLAGLPPARLLSALAQAFSYPAEGLGATLEPLHALDGEDCGEWAGLVEEALAAAGAFEGRTAEQLAYTRLFIGSLRMEAPPYASYYLEEGRVLNGRAAVEVEAIYAQFGLELKQDQKAPADHLRYLLAFLALLAGRYEQTGEPAFAEAYADFRSEYVASWLGQCARLVDINAEEPYYPALMRLIASVVG